jgi:hypothetical protein
MPVLSYLHQLFNAERCPIGVCEWFVGVHHRSEYLTGQAAGSTT